MKKQKHWKTFDDGTFSIMNVIYYIYIKDV